MRKLYFLFILFYSHCHAQYVQGDLIRKEHSKKNVEFVIDNFGKRVGKGICYELAYEAIKQGHPKDFEMVVTHASRYKISESKDVIPGDIVIFKNVVYDNSGTIDTINYHIGIVMEMTSAGFYFAEQNCGDRNDSTITAIGNKGRTYEVFTGSKVEETFFEFDNVLSGTVAFFRF